MRTPNLADPRHHHVDALRAIAFSLLILYHIGMLYVFDWDWHVKSSYQSELVQVPMLIVNRWRMDLIFLISGIATVAILAKRSIGEFVRSRSARLLIPLMFGMLVVVPIQPYCQGVMNGKVEPDFWLFLSRYYSGYAWPAKAFDGWQYGFTWNHLWYLVYLFFYTLIYAAWLALKAKLPVLNRLSLRHKFQQLQGARLIIWPIIPLIAFTVLLRLRFPTTHDLIHDWYSHAFYFTMFLFGCWIGRSAMLWAAFARLRRYALVIALVSYALHHILQQVLSGPIEWLEWLTYVVLINVYVWTMLVAILGFACTYLNRPFAWLAWANRAVYPWYVLHQSVIIFIAYWLIPLKLGGLVELSLVLIGTVACCWWITACVQRVPGMAMLLGTNCLRNRNDA